MSRLVAVASAEAAGEKEDQEAVAELKQQQQAVMTSSLSGDVPLAYSECGTDHLGIKSVTASEFPGEL